MATSLAMDPFSTSLQVPAESSPGPSRTQAYTRPVSVQPVATSSPSASGRKRASHTPVTNQQQEEQPTYRDVYSHPAALEYAAAHPRRTIPKFGPYLLLQTLGEGEFGKVKLGLHMQWGEEVAVKLIRRGNIDSSVRMSKVEREIEVLRTLKHPNIVRLYDVIETDKFIGIILEYASGGELFDHILAHRYLREKDACKLFSQLLSGVWYIHEKKIVHRDLKLENLLLDRHRNVIITDFGFANRFEHRADDLMQTSCGSPCYAAPELVISDGLYVGSAVDIWSCGVILYAMLAGYLPFDDDPANPDGDNINLLYKYIVNTPLSFPDYISADARDLLSIMLVPDPLRRADLKSIMAHRWLAPYHSMFTKSVDDLERAAMEQHHQKRLAYQRQMRQNASESQAGRVSRSHSSRADNYSSPASAGHSSRSHRHAQPEYLYETPADQSVYQSSRRGVTSAIVMPTSPAVVLDDDPFAPTPSQEVPDISLPIVASPNEIRSAGGAEDQYNGAEAKSGEKRPAIEPVKTSPDAKRKKDGFRHTIQVEVGEPDKSASQRVAPPVIATTPKKTPTPSSTLMEMNGTTPLIEHAREPSNSKPLPSTPHVPRSQSSTPKFTDMSSAEPTPVVAIEVTSPPATPAAVNGSEKVTYTQTPSGSTGSKQSRHRKGLSIDKIGIAKIFGGGSPSEAQANGKVSRTSSRRSTPQRAPSTDTITPATNGKQEVNRRPSTVQVTSSVPVPDPITAAKATLSPTDSISGKSTKNSRRNTLTVMVEPFKKQLARASKGNPSPAPETPYKEKVTPTEKQKLSGISPGDDIVQLPPSKEIVPPSTPYGTTRPDLGRGFAVPASTVKASKVMNWFRSKSKGKPLVDEPEKVQPSETESSQQLLSPNAVSASSSSSVINGPPPPPTDKGRLHPSATGPPQRSVSAHNETSFSATNFADLVWRRHPTTKGALRVHHGAVDPTNLTTRAPPEVMKHVTTILEGMGVDIQIEGDFKYRCVRPKRRKAAGVGLGLRDTGNGLAAFSITGTAASNGIDKRGLPQPQSSSFGSGGMLRGLLMRRQSSQVSSTLVAQSIDNDVNPEAALAAAVPNDGTSPAVETIYGDQQQDQGDEVRFSVELTRIDRLEDTYSLDIRRLKGNLRSYKFLYDTFRDRADLRR